VLRSNGASAPTWATAYYSYSTTAPSSPTIGQTYYETDTGELLVYYGATTGWKPPWDLPWGLMLLVTDNTNRTYSTTGATMTGFTGSVATIAGRRYKISITCRAYNTGGAAFFTLQPRVDGVGQNNHTGYSASASLDQSYSFVDTYAENTTSSRTFSMFAQAGSGTLTISSAYGKAVFLVEDIGPVGNPPAS
jgi:hypothetical protein